MKNFILVLSMLMTFSVWSQEIPFFFKGKVTNQDVGSNEPGVTVSIVQNGVTVVSKTTTSSGKWVLQANVNLNSTFDIIFAKSGMVSKKLHFDFSTLNEEDVPPGEFQPLQPLDISLFKERENVDFSFLDTEPIGEFRWSVSGSRAKLDIGANAAMKDKIDQLLLQEEIDKGKKDADYQEAIFQGAAAYDEVNYEKALEEYTKANEIKPEELLPKEKIKELEALIKAQEIAEAKENETDDKYDKLIASAETLRDAGDPEAAIAKFKEAILVKDETYPNDQISLLSAQVEQNKKDNANQVGYDAAMSAGENFLKQNSLRAAKDKFVEANKLKPNEPLPKAKLKEIEDKLKAGEELEIVKKQYDEAIIAADAFLAKEEWQSAKDKYVEALSYENSSSYAKEKKKFCEDKLGLAEAEEAKKKQIQELLDAGNSSMTSKAYESAVTSFEGVLALEAGNPEATEKLALANQKLEESSTQAAKEAEFKDLEEQGDAKFAAENYQESIDKYEAATAIIPSTEVSKKIADAKVKLEEEGLAAARTAEFDKLIEDGNQLLADNKLTEAKTNFEKAKKIDALSTVPPAKIKEIDALLADQKSDSEKLENYKGLIAEADNLFGTEKWTESEAKYTEALSLTEDKTYAEGRIAEIKVKLASDEALAEKKAKYESLIAEAKTLFDSEKWTEAETKYTDALNFTDDKDFANGKIEEIQAKLSGEQAVAERLAKYEELITEADGLYDTEKWTGAETKYKEALTFTDENTYAEGRINGIQSKLAGNQVQAEKDAKYEELITSADGLFGSEDWTDADSKYKEALNYTDDKKYAQDQIDAIIVKLGEEKIEGEQLAKIETLLTEGKNLFNSKSFEDSRGKYEEVLGLDGENTEAKTQIERINTELAALKSNADKEDEFNKLRDEGIALAGAKDYTGALSKLNEALVLKDDSAVKTKIAEIEKLEKEISETDSEYNGLIAEAEGLTSSEKYPEAITKYKEALAVKPLDPAPLAKIAEIEAKMKDGEAQVVIDKEYDGLMAKGEEFMAKNEYQNAIKEFNAALKVKPTENEPVARAEEAERLALESNSDFDRLIKKNLDIAEKKIDEKNYDRALKIISDTEKLSPGEARLTQLRDRITLIKQQEKDYNNLMTAADGLAGSKDYSGAKLKYEEASRKKPELDLPKEKIEEMKTLIDNLANSVQREKLYTDYMEDGGNYQSAESYQQALSSYQDALSIKEGDVPATNKINEIQQILDDIANVTEADRKKKNEFDKLIKDADGLFASETYPDAKGVYVQALSIFPTNNYAKLQIDECVRLSMKKSLDELDVQYQKIITAGNNSFDEEEYEKAILRYKTARTLRPKDEYPKKRLAEIDAILHPVELVKVELEDLGTPFYGSILDGGSLLSQAEAERKQLKTNAVTEKLEVITEAATARSAEKTKEHLENSNRIYQVQMGIIAESGEKDIGRQESLEILRASERELAEIKDDATQSEQLSNISDQDLLYSINEEVALDYGVRSEVYEENTVAMQKYSTEVVELKDLMSSIDNARSHSEDQRIRTIKQGIRGEMIDDFAERDAVRQEVVDIKDKVYTEYDIAARSRYEELIEAQISIDDTQKDFDAKQAENSLVAGENNEELRAISKNVTETAEALVGIEDESHFAVNGQIDEIKQGYDAKAEEDRKAVLANNDELMLIKDALAAEQIIQDSKEMNQLQKADRDMALIKIEIRDDNGEKDVNREATVEALRIGERELSEATADAYNQEQLENYNSQSVITDAVNENSEVSKLADNAFENNVEGMKLATKKAQLNVNGIALSDEEERLNSQKAIGDVYESVELAAAKEQGKQVESAQALEEAKRVIDQNAINHASGESDKHYAAADKIHSINDDREKKVKEANSLGEEYPEGVSQESFTQNDQNGLMVAVITRRIVVIDGHADVYIRTQSLNAITFSKNGTPSLQHVWNSETQGPNLVRHF